MSEITAETPGEDPPPAINGEVVTLDTGQEYGNLDEEQPDDLPVSDSDSGISLIEISEATYLLQELVTMEALQPDRAQILKYKYMDIYGKFIESRDYEQSLLSEVRSLRTWLIRHKELTDAFESAPPPQLDAGDTEADDNKVNTLRTKLLRISNDLELSRERIVKLDFEENNCREEIEELNSEQERISKLDNEEELLRELETSIDDLCMDIKQRQVEVGGVQGEIELALTNLKNQEEEYEQILIREDKAKKELVQSKTAPTNILVAIDSINRQKDELFISIQDKQSQVEALLSDFAKNKDEVKRREELKESLQVELEQLMARNREGQEEFSDMERGINQGLLEQGSFESDFILVDKQMKELSEEVKKELEQLDKRQKAHDSHLKHIKRTDMNISRLEGELELLRGVQNNLQIDIDNRNAPIPDIEKRIGEMQRSLRENQSLLEAQVFSHSTVDQDLSEIKVRENRVITQISDLEKEMKESCLIEKTCLKEREADMEKMYKLRITLEQIIDQIKTKSGVISEESKCLKDLENKVKYYTELHQTVKGEVSGIIQLIQDFKQKSAELKEKYKILETELSTCKDDCDRKSKLLQRSRLKYTSVIGVRDSFLIDLSKVRIQLVETRSEIEEQRGEIKKMAGMINAAEEEMVKLRKKYELMLQERNDRGIQLIERNEETAIFYEKLNVQDSVLRRGNIQLESREEELRFLRVEIRDIQRQIDTLRKSTPKAIQLEQELVDLQQQMSEAHETLRVLERRAEKPSENPARLVEVGSFPVGSFEELQVKSLKLEEQLIGKETQVMERELLLEHVERITEKAQTRVKQTCAYTRDQSSHMCEIQNQLKESTKKLMALLSELSMLRASSLQLQREVDEKENELVENYQRLEQGLPPSEQAEISWERMVRVEKARERHDEVIASEASSKTDLGGGVLTTAHRRPNAYIPDCDGELPIPKPYGSHAPFKPSEQGSNIRHIRKPVLKPIQL
ncbi:coiled-coil domain-containing protein [Oopsacas minuta]|uniref:Coiled-coil domain-containing protein n=1 Tax=Oopsacas minuta TaxID=111878 RepID=A0AAV7JXN1_9METZ|nr:coiled-coil domain-containing protein [Oopsacas minuta]